MKKIILLFLLIIIARCSQGTIESNIISIENAIANKEDIKLSNYFSSIDYIQIENNDDILLTGAKSIDLRTDGKYLFLCNEKLSQSKDACYKYSKDGKFLNKIGIKGNGPGEFTTIFNIEILPEEEIIQVYDNNKVTAYNYTGEVQYQEQREDLDEEQAKKCELNKTNIHKYTNYHEHSMLYPNNDTIKNLDGTARYILNYGKYKQESVEKVKIALPKFIETSGFIKLEAIFTPKEYPSLTPRERFCKIIYDKKTGIAKSLKPDPTFAFDGFINDIEGGIPFWPTYSYKNKAYQIIDAIDFIDMAEKSNSAKIKELASGLTENSNPIIMMAIIK